MSLVIQKIEWTNKEGTVILATYTNIPEPTTYGWGKQDISNQGAGRTVSSDAIKLLKGKARTLEFSWNNRDFAVISTVFKAFDTEYAWITFFDALEGKHVRKHFYMGDMNANMYNYVVQGGLWEVAKVKCIQAITDKV